MKKVVLAFAVSTGLFSCEQSKMENVQGKSLVDISIVSNKIDPICDMPVEGHLSDTALIDGKVWGFCSSACKEKYLNSK